MLRIRSGFRYRVLVAMVCTFATAGPAQVRRVVPRSALRGAADRADLARFRARVEAALGDTQAAKGYWGVLVVDANTGETLYALNADRYFAPASNTKLFTAALALATLGPDYRFHTTIETRGTVDKYGRLRGDLVLVGRGDPNLSNVKFPYVKKVETDGPLEKALAELADAVAARGIKQIEGDVVADDSYFSYERYPPGWSIDDMTTLDGAAVSAIGVNNNVLEIQVHSGERIGQPAWFGVEPWADYYSFENQITTGAADSVLKVEVEREPGSRHVVLRGSTPLVRESQTLPLAIEEPAEYAAALLKRLLEARNVRIYGQPRAQHLSRVEPRDTAKASAGVPLVLADHVSPPLIEAVRLLNKVSQNLHAEMLLRTIAHEKTGVGSRDAGLKLMQDFLASIGIADGDVFFTDGSGLSRRNLVTPQAVVTLLRFVTKQPWGEAYLGTLPVAGDDGTLQNRMKDTPAAGRIRAKTGSFEHVGSLAGFVTTLHGAHLIFSVFGNNDGLSGKDAAKVVDTICAAMVEEIGPPAGVREKREAAVSAPAKK